ncbi:MAG: diaminopimelate epimerase [Ruminococcus sp.]|nr:diaminopimelate epimerase [Ruminococcus sp.]
MLTFSKMHGIGNSYIYINCFQETVPNPEKLAIFVSDIRFGIGSDGLILIMPSEIADFRMRIFNADGSEAMMCGNGTRCVGKYVYDMGLTDKTNVSLETNAGIKYLTLYPGVDGKIESVKVDMGKAILIPREIPMNSNLDRFVAQPITIDGMQYCMTCVSIGNPHAIVFLPEIDTLNLEKIGPSFEYYPLFPNRVNTEFVRIIDDHTLQMRVWERGSGETFACGTGTCASVVAAILNGYCRKEDEILVHLRGGDLRIIYHEDENVTMIGPATFVFEGKMEVPEF